MLFRHHDLGIELDDAWWTEAGMDGFVPSSPAYRVDAAAVGGQTLWQVTFADMAPVRRNPGVGIFNTSETKTARERVVSILRDFRRDAALYPIEVVDEPAGSPFRYKLTHGVHRLYCSLAAGFTHVPVVEGFDITAPYI
jgi:hypothetical protein